MQQPHFGWLFFGKMNSKNYYREVQSQASQCNATLRKLDKDPSSKIEPGWESLSVPKPQTSLKLLQEISNLRLNDLDLDSEDDVPFAAPSFHSGERLYNGLVNIEVGKECSFQIREKLPRPPLKRDKQPNSSEYLTYNLPSEHFFRTVLTSDFPEVSPPRSSHALYRLTKRWDNN